MDDLITRLTAAIDETERNGFLGQSPLGYVTADKVYLPTEVQFVYYSEDVTARQAVLRGCVADRRMLARHAPKPAKFVLEGDTQLLCGCSVDPDEFYANLWPCEDIRDMAERYGLEGTDG
jgi:hypothetical protein